MESGSVPVQAEQETHIQGKLKEKPSDQQGEYKDLQIYVEERELIMVEPKEIYKFHLGPGDENLTLQIDKNLQIHIQGQEVRVVELKEQFRCPLGSARQGENPAQQTNKDQEIHIPACGTGKSTDDPPAKRFFLADESDDDDDDTDLPHISDGPKNKAEEQLLLILQSAADLIGQAEANANLGAPPKL